MADRPTPILVEHPPRDLPEDRRYTLHDAPPICIRGALFVDELFRERRISSVEWTALRDSIWPCHPSSGKAALAVKEQPNSSSPPQGT